MRRSILAASVLLAGMVVNGCGREEPVSSGPLQDEQAALTKPAKGGGSILATINDGLAAQGASVRVAMAEWITDAGSGQMGQTIFANNRSKQLGSHWVPGDPRRGGATDITYMVDQSEGGTTSGLVNAQTEAAIDGAMGTWSGAQCSTIPLTKLPYNGLDLGVVEFIFGFGGQPFIWFADLSHAGWAPGPFFDILAPGGSGFILGVTFTFIFVDGGGNPTDIDNNGKIDVAFREINYNDAFPWGINTSFPIDVETVALHEAGHGLSQGHFGKIFGTNANGKIHFAPLAVMNAAYSQVQQSLAGTDNGGHCSIWGSWPNN